MWARQSELAIALWMAVSPFLFHSGQESWMWVHDFVIAIVIASLALLSYRPGLGRTHLLQIVVASWLVGFGWWHAHDAGRPAPAIFQNWIIVGLLLLLFAIVPSHAFTPPGRRSAR